MKLAPAPPRWPKLPYRANLPTFVFKDLQGSCRLRPPLSPSGCCHLRTSPSIPAGLLDYHNSPFVDESSYPGLCRTPGHPASMPCFFSHLIKYKYIGEYRPQAIVSHWTSLSTSTLRFSGTCRRLPPCVIRAILYHLYSVCSSFTRCLRSWVRSKQTQEIGILFVSTSRSSRP